MLHMGVSVDCIFRGNSKAEWAVLSQNSNVAAILDDIRVNAVIFGLNWWCKLDIPNIALSLWAASLVLRCSGVSSCYSLFGDIYINKNEYVCLYVRIWRHYKYIRLCIWRHYKYIKGRFKEKFQYKSYNGRRNSRGNCSRVNSKGNFSINPTMAEETTEEAAQELMPKGLRLKNAKPRS